MPNYDVSKHVTKLSEGAAIAGFGAIDGIVTSYTISYISSLSPFIADLSPFTIGGMIGVGLLTSAFITSVLVKDLVLGSKAFSKKMARAIAYTGAAFGIGAGLVALDVTSSAAIGATVTVVNIGAISSLFALLERPREFKHARSERYSDDLSNRNLAFAFPTQ